MSRPCVCGGSNENCRYCNGLGSIPDGLSDALTVHTHLPESKKIHIDESEPLTGWRSPNLSFRDRLAALIAMLTKKDAPVSAPSDNRPDHHWVLCPKGCGARLRPDEVQHHLRRSHPFTPPKDRKSRMALPSGSKLVFNICPECKARVRGDRLNRHLKKVHKSQPVRTRVVAKPKTDLVPSAKDVLRESTTLAAPLDKNLDATKLYAHSYREHGRFGSHPSHDGFDDESGPN
jgi:hypothetical protein